jgi:hypothetical protein
MVKRRRLRRLRRILGPLNSLPVARQMLVRLLHPKLLSR